MKDYSNGKITMKKNTKGKITKALIVNKSLQLFSVKGFHNTSMSDIMEETNLTKGGIYAHFKSKDLIWYACYDRAVAMWRNIIFDNMRMITNPYERLVRLIEKHLFDYVGSNIFKQGGFFLSMLIEFSGQCEDKTAHVLKGFTGYSQLIESWINEGVEKGLIKDTVNSNEVGNFIVSTFYGATVIYTASKNEKILRQAANQLHNFLKSLKVSPEQ